MGGHFLFGTPPPTWIPFFDQASSGPFSRQEKTTHKLIMAEESQPKKRHKTSVTHIQCDFPQESPNGDDLDPQIPIPTGEDEQKQIPLDDHDLDKDGNAFNDTDARKSLDYYLFQSLKIFT
jgi:hypothetical protein